MNRHFPWQSRKPEEQWHFSGIIITGLAQELINQQCFIPSNLPTAHTLCCQDPGRNPFMKFLQAVAFELALSRTAMESGVTEKGTEYECV